MPSCAHKEEWWIQARGRVGDEGGDRTNEGSGIPMLEFGGGTGTKEVQLDWTDSVDESP